MPTPKIFILTNTATDETHEKNILLNNMKGKLNEKKNIVNERKPRLK